MQENDNFVDESKRKVLLKPNFTYVIGFALRDPIREKVADSIKNLTEAEVRVRMISGDLYETAVATALKAGIITPEDI